MYLKIYFDNKPLFLCDEISSDIEPYAHHDDAVLIEELSTHAINTMLHEIKQDKVHAGIMLHENLDSLKKAFYKKFEVIRAAGGWVLNEKGEALFILRRGKWDLPKGKLDEAESLEDCALREVQEETGLKKLTLQQALITTYHTYYENNQHILKESYWYTMKTSSDQKLVPQAEEQITALQWAPREEWMKIARKTYPLIKDIVETAEQAGDQ